MRSSVPLEGKTKSLDSVESVRSSLANNHTIDFEKVTNMVIGYKEDDQPDKDDIEVQRNSELCQHGIFNTTAIGTLMRMGGLNK